MFSGFKRLSTVPSGKAAKASLVGAKTIKGPAFTNAFSNCAACTAATKVEWSLDPIAICNTLGVDSSSVIKACPCLLSVCVSTVGLVVSSCPSELFLQFKNSAKVEAINKNL